MDNSLKKIFSVYSQLSENKKLMSEIMVSPSSTSYSTIKFAERTKKDQINKPLLDDIETAAKAAGVTVTVDFAKTGHNSTTSSGNPSRHSTNTAVDIDYIGGKVVSPANRDVVDKFVNALISMGYNKNAEGPSNPKAVLTFGFPGHDNHVHVSNTTNASSNIGNNYSQVTGNTESDNNSITGRYSDAAISKLAGNAFGKVFGLKESSGSNSKFYITFCNVSNPMIRNNQKVSVGQVIGKTRNDVVVSKYDEVNHKINLSSNEFNLGRNARDYFDDVIIPSSNNEKIKSPINGVINNGKYRCQNQITIESDVKNITPNDKKSYVGTSSIAGRYSDPLMSDLAGLPAKIFKDKYDDSGNLKQKRWGYPGEKVDPWIVDTLSAPFKKIGSFFKEEETRKTKKLNENINNIKRLLK